jgi:hypothetical protein
MNRRKVLLCFSILALMSGVLFLINSSWTFLNPETGFLDSHIYLGYMIYGPYHFIAFKDLYYTTRIPPIVLGWLAHSTLPDLEATVVLRFYYLLITTVSICISVAIITRSTAIAVLIGVLALADPYVLWASGWDYVDGAGTAYLSLTIAFFTSAIRSRSVLSFALAGAAFSLAVGSYLILAFFAPAFVIYICLGLRKVSVTDLVRFGAAASIAFLFVLALQGLASASLGGHFLFLQPEITAAFSITRIRSSWKLPNYNWLNNATWLVIQAAVFLSCCIMVLARAFQRKEIDPTDEAGGKITLAAALAYIFPVILFVILEICGFWLLQFSYDAIYLLPFAFVILGGIFGLALKDSSPRIHWALALFCLAVVPAIWVVLQLGLVPPNAAVAPCAPKCALTGVHSWALLAIGLLGLLAASIFMRQVRLRQALIGTLAAGSCISLLLLFVLSFDKRIFQFPDRGANRGGYLQLISALREIKTVNEDDSLYFWFDLKSPGIGPYAKSLASAHLYGYRIVSDSFPSVIHPFEKRSILEPQMRVALISDSADALTLAQQSLAKIGLQEEPEGSLQIPWQDRTTTVHILRIEKAVSL